MPFFHAAVVPTHQMTAKILAAPWFGDKAATLSRDKFAPGGSKP
jgi:hypothetical protein